MILRLGLRPDAASLCHIILFADCLIYLGSGIDHNREIAVRIKAGCWNGNGPEHAALGGLERRCRNVHGSSRGKSHAGNRRWSTSLALVLYDDSQLRRSCHVTIRIGTSKAPIRKGDEVWGLKRFFWRDASSGHKNPEAAVHGHSQMCSRSRRSCAHQQKCTCPLPNISTVSSPPVGSFASNFVGPHLYHKTDPERGRVHVRCEEVITKCHLESKLRGRGLSRCEMR